MHSYALLHQTKKHAAFSSRLVFVISSGLVIVRKVNIVPNTYAHGVGEIRQPPPNRKELAGARNEEWMQFLDDDQKIIHKMGLCKKYYNGKECPYDDKCSFLHRLRDDSWKSREACALSIGSIGDGSNSNSLEGNRSVNKPARGTYWKIKDCHYSHGEAVDQIKGNDI
ncbi:putative transcription factor C3H family [Medicago truncatula]|uniref:Putative transcription factor C3H family n=1 Tax=Medicago truncatula TaxID=3880 RepID=A0A396GK98_MEDTR|nr:putative transcription factor C3H family [Medicago truncatula]